MSSSGMVLTHQTSVVGGFQRLPRRESMEEAASSVALMGSLVVVVVEEPLQGRVQLLRGGEIPAAEGDAPMLVKDPALQALGEAVGSRVARLGARVSEPEIVTRLH